MADIESILSRNGFNVSHETIEKLNTYEALLKKWQRAINLVGKSTLPEVATRHFLDSVQLHRFIPDSEVTLVDIGSGAGFPGMVLAILGVKDVHLVESDQRKAEFLRTVSRETKTPVTVHDKRIEVCSIPNVNIVTARALASLSDLLGFARHLDKSGGAMGLFLKGQQYQSEINVAQDKYSFTFDVHDSLTDSMGKIIQVNKVSTKNI